MTDPIADLLTRLRNAGMAKKSSVLLPHSKEKESILNVMKKYGYILSFEVSKNSKGFKDIKIELDIDKNHRTSYKRISKPGQRIFIHSEDVTLYRNYE